MLFLAFFLPTAVYGVFNETAFGVPLRLLTLYYICNWSISCAPNGRAWVADEKCLGREMAELRKSAGK